MKLAVCVTGFLLVAVLTSASSSERKIYATASRAALLETESLDDGLIDSLAMVKTDRFKRGLGDILTSVGKTAAQKAVGAAAKGAAKTVAKSAVKSVARTATKQAVTNVAKTASKTVAKTTVNSVAKTSVKKVATNVAETATDSKNVKNLEPLVKTSSFKNIFTKPSSKKEVAKTPSNSILKFGPKPNTNMDSSTFSVSTVAPSTTLAPVTTVELGKDLGLFNDAVAGASAGVIDIALNPPKIDKLADNDLKMDAESPTSILLPATKPPAKSFWQSLIKKPPVKPTTTTTVSPISKEDSSDN